MVKKGEKKEKEEIPVSNDVPFILKRMFKQNGITDDKKIIEIVRGK